MVTVADPIFTLRSPDGIRSGSLFDIMAGVVCGALVDLPAMQAHQRAPVVTALAVMMRAIELYAERLLQDAVDWQAFSGSSTSFSRPSRPVSIVWR